MSKIKITESELRQLIGEGVVSVLNERINYGAEWETLSEPEKRAAAEQYYKNAIFHPSMGGVTYTYPDGTTGTSAYKYDQATGQQLQGTANYNMDAAKEIYNRKRSRKQRKGNLTYSADQFNRSQEQNTNQIKQLNAQLKQSQNLNKGYSDAIQQIANALKVQLAEAVGSVPSFEASISGTGGVAVPTPEQNTEMLVKSAVPQLPQILKAIQTLKGRMAQLAKANTALTAQNKSLTTRIKNNQMVAQGPQSTPIPATNQPQVTAPTQPATLARPKVAAPGNAQV